MFLTNSEGDEALFCLQAAVRGKGAMLYSCCLNEGKGDLVEEFLKPIDVGEISMVYELKKDPDQSLYITGVDDSQVLKILFNS